MRLGQTSIIYFVSRFLASLLGFGATIYFARELGAEPLGIYHLVLGLVSWLAIAGKVGISGAMKKRVSEGNDQGAFALAGTVLVFVIFVVLAGGLLVFRSPVESYLGYPAVGFVVLILFVTLSNSIVNSLLIGVHLVHVSGLLSPTKTGGRALFQVVAVLAGAGVTGLFLGYIAGYLLVVLIGLVVLSQRIERPSRPQRHHVQSLFEYAKFSWLGNLQSRMFNYTDVLVLGLFVSSSLIGVYSIAWNIAQFFLLFAGAIKTTFFPEISRMSTEEDQQAVAGLVEDTLAYAGLLLIPGLVGGAILGERLLRIYGPEFTQGQLILVILIAANLLMSYQNQILNTLNAIDRPEFAFRANVVFVVGNLALNLVLIYLYGWIGAAVATTLSVTASLVIGYHYLSALLPIAVPYGEIVRQGLAALLMGAVVTGGLWVENSYGVLNHNAATVVVLVGLGAATYFLVLLGISGRFRRTVSDNLPFEGSRLVG